MSASPEGADRRPCIVVGYDGSPAARAAVSLAVNRVGPGGHLVVVHAYEVPSDWLGWPEFELILDASLAHGRTILEALPEATPEIAGISWEMENVEGRPAEVLNRVADVRQADEIVLASRGVGRARALLGSVAHELIHVATRPVTVLPERALEEIEAGVRTDAGHIAGSA